jgi:phosphate transport system substrate-binding protein
MATRPKDLLAAFAFAAASCLPAAAQDVLGTTGIRGAGSTFAYPVLSRWSREYREFLASGGAFPVANAGLEDPPASTALEYEPVGSLAGMLRVKAAEVDFGASDVPLKPEELAKLGLIQFPIVIGGVVAVVNIDGVAPGKIRFTGPILAEIFLGNITSWSDPALAALNPGLKLPDARIAVIRRADGSGTTFNFTEYLSRMSPAWKEKVGSDLTVAWPVGTGARGNVGVSRAVQQTKNSIGYVEYAQALQSRLSFASVRNRAGKFITPGGASFQSAAASADWSKAGDFDLLLLDAPGEDAYPIVATVFVLMRTKAPRKRALAVVDFFEWSLDKGAGHAAQLGYVPLPEPLVRQVRSYWGASFRPGT